MFKNLLFILAALFFSACAHAQFNKGDILLGGQLGYSYSKSITNINTYQKSGNGQFIVSIGKAISENAVFGVNLSYLPSWITEYDNNDVMTFESKSHTYGIGVYYRKYKSLGKDFFIFGEGGGSYFATSQTGKDGLGNEISSSTTNAGQLYITPGISYKVSKHLLLDITLPNVFYAQYSSSKSPTNPPSDLTSNQFSINTSLSSNPLDALNIGFRLIL
jgi:hypothetical protein